jgi:hypothetical protein
MGHFEREEIKSQAARITLLERELAEARRERDEANTRLNAANIAASLVDPIISGYRMATAIALKDRDEAKAQLDTFIKTAADAVSEQGRMETAGRVLAKEVCEMVYEKAYYGRTVDPAEYVTGETVGNPTALAWIKQAQEEASNG